MDQNRVPIILLQKILFLLFGKNDYFISKTGGNFFSQTEIEGSETTPLITSPVQSMHRAYRMLAKQLCKKQWNGGSDRMIMNDIKIMKYCIKCRQKRIDHRIQNLLFKCKNPLDPDVLFQISIMPLLPASVVHGYLMSSGSKSGRKLINYHLYASGTRREIFMSYHRYFHLCLPFHLYFSEEECLLCDIVLTLS